MQKSRAEYLEVCKVCTERGFDMKKGLICALTKDHAAYTTPQCEDFDLDQVAAKKKAVSDALRKEDQEHSATLGLSKFGIKNQLIAGIIVATISIVWLIVGLANNLLFYYPIILLVIGIVFTIKGAITESKKVKANFSETPHDILDDDLE